MKRLGPFRLRRDVVQRFYDIHSWTGILGGLALFICAFSGTIALFERELLAWEQPAIRIEPGTSPLGVDDLIASAKDRLGPTQDLFVGLPDGSHGVLQARVFSHGEVDEIFIDPYSGAIVDAADETAFAFLTHLHTDLHLPRPFGRYLVGLLGVLMMASLIAGALAHPRILKDLFLLRWRPSLRLSASDVHKQVGVWGLAFGTVMAFTGAVIGLLGLIAPIMVLSAFGGDVGKATEAFSGPAFEETGVETTMLPLGPLIDQLEEQRPGFAVTSFFIRHWGDETAEAAFNLERDPYRQLTAGETHRLSLVDGRTIHVTTFTDAGVGSRLFGAMQPVHYALFGGLGLKLLYFVSGLVLSLGIVTGTLLWFERRRAVGADGRGRYRRLARLHLGASIGLILATAVAVAAGRFAPSAIEPSFWLTWALATVAAFLVSDSFALTRAGGWATGAVLVAVAVGDLIGSPRLIPTAVQVDLVLLVLGLLTIALTSLAPRQRPERGTPETDSEPSRPVDTEAHPPLATQP